MGHFKVRVMPRSQLVIYKIITFQRSSTGGTAVTKSGAAAGMRLKGLLCTDTNRDGGRLLMKPFQKASSHDTSIGAAFCCVSC